MTTTRSYETCISEESRVYNDDLKVSCKVILIPDKSDDKLSSTKLVNGNRYVTEVHFYSTYAGDKEIAYLDRNDILWVCRDHERLMIVDNEDILTRELKGIRDCIENMMNIKINKLCHYYSKIVVPNK
jgi:hypothetical protein